MATTNPRPWEYDHTFAEPDEVTWRKVSLTVERLDGSVVDLELLRPEWWVEANKLRVGQLMPLQVEELEVDGHATVTAIEPCPALATGTGSVVTGRFVTRRVDVLVEAMIRAANGTRETITGTPIHPIWSVTRNEWVPLGELTEGELLLGETDTAVVETIAIHERRAPVYNLEIHGEHVYQVGQLGVLVHNTGDGVCDLASSAAKSVAPDKTQTVSITARIKGLLTNYPKVIDPRTGSPIPFPSGLKGVVDKQFRVDWDKADRAAFIAEWYKRGFASPRGGWKHYDIHHIQPREFGGTNDFWNLVPVERNTHQNLFNAFWRDFPDL